MLNIKTVKLCYNVLIWSENIGQVYQRYVICGFRFQLAKQSRSRIRAVSSSNHQSNSSKNDKTTHSVPHSRPVSLRFLLINCSTSKSSVCAALCLQCCTSNAAVSIAVMPQHGLEELECRQCSPRPPPELMHAGSDRRASKRGRQSG